MNIDFSKLVQESKTAADKINQESNGDGKMLYVTGGTTPGAASIKVMYNPKSQRVLRLIKRIEYNGNKLVDIREFGYESQLLKVVDMIKTKHPEVDVKCKVVTRGLCYGMFVKSTNQQVQGTPGEIYLCMMPKMIYGKLNELFGSYEPDVMRQVVASSSGFAISFVNAGTGGASALSVTPDINTVNLGISQEEYEAKMMETADLNDAIYTINPKNVDKIKEYIEADRVAAAELSAIYLKDMGNVVGVEQAPVQGIWTAPTADAGAVAGAIPQSAPPVNNPPVQGQGQGLPQYRPPAGSTPGYAPPVDQGYVPPVNPPIENTAPPQQTTVPPAAPQGAPQQYAPPAQPSIGAVPQSAPPAGVSEVNNTAGNIVYGNNIPPLPPTNNGNSNGGQ